MNPDDRTGTCVRSTGNMSNLNSEYAIKFSQSPACRYVPFGRTEQRTIWCGSMISRLPRAVCICSRYVPAALPPAAYSESSTVSTEDASGWRRCGTAAAICAMTNACRPITATCGPRGRKRSGIFTFYTVTAVAAPSAGSVGEPPFGVCPISRRLFV